MTSYEQQLDSLRNNLTQLREVFGNFDNVKEVRDMVSINLPSVSSLLNLDIVSRHPSQKAHSHACHLDFNFNF